MKNTFHTRYHLTQNGFALLKSKLRAFEKERKKQIARLRSLRNQQSIGLLAEDSMYIQTLSSLQFIEVEIKRLTSTLANAEVIKAVRRRKQQVTLGSSVHLRGNNGDIVYTIVDSVEADPFNGKISGDSPVGRVLLGKKIKDFITLPSKRKTQSVQLIGIE